MKLKIENIYSKKMQNIQTIMILVLLLGVNTILAQSNLKKHGSKPITVGFSIGLFNDVDIRDAEVAIQMWGNEVLTGLGIDYYPDAKIYHNNEDLLSDIKEDNIDLISLLTTEYLEIVNKTEIEPFLMTRGRGKYGFTFILLSRKDKDITRLEDLKNKKINIPSGSFGQLVKMWLECSLFDSDIKYSKFFSEVREFDKPSRALFPVFFKQIDACVVSEESYNTMIELNPQLKNDLTIIAKSPEFVNGMMCINKKLGKTIREITLTTAEEISKTASGKQILALFRSDDLIRFNPEYLKNTKELYDKYNKINK